MKTEELFTENDFVDDGGYHKRADHLCDMVNERIRALILERDEARDLVKLVSQTMGTHSLLMSGWVKDWENKNGGLGAKE